MNEITLMLPQLEIRSLDKSLETSIGILVVDRKKSLIIESRDDTKENYYQAAGLAHILTVDLLHYPMPLFLKPFGSRQN